MSRAGGPCTEDSLHSQVQCTLGNGHMGQADRHTQLYGKHYLPATSLAGGKNLHFISVRSGRFACRENPIRICHFMSSSKREMILHMCISRSQINCTYLL